MRLTQILLNLISNAVKFTNHGQVDVNVTVANETDKNIRVQFSITDTGIGIEKDKLNKIFKVA